MSEKRGGALSPPDPMGEGGERKREAAASRRRDSLARRRVLRARPPEAWISSPSISAETGVIGSRSVGSQRPNVASPVLPPTWAGYPGFGPEYSPVLGFPNEA